MEGLIVAGQVATSGQYVVNGQFGNILLLLFAIFPVTYTAGIVTAIGYYGKSIVSMGR